MLQYVAHSLNTARQRLPTELALVGLLTRLPKYGKFKHTCRVGDYLFSEHAHGPDGCWQRPSYGGDAMPTSQRQKHRPPVVIP